MEHRQSNKRYPGFQSVMIYRYLHVLIHLEGSGDSQLLDRRKVVNLTVFSSLLSTM
ncbi:hypothetical protein BC835DRAFT_1332575 [Cytidiella melzeri]|nr:hypothetical protein BC835DRAFT_1332575 [Cytidiella melzeri]